MYKLKTDSTEFLKSYDWLIISYNLLKKGEPCVSFWNFSIGLIFMNAFWKFGPQIHTASLQTYSTTMLQWLCTAIKHILTGSWNHLICCQVIKTVLCNSKNVEISKLVRSLVKWLKQMTLVREGLGSIPMRALTFFGTFYGCHQMSDLK